MKIDRKGREREKKREVQRERGKEKAEWFSCIVPPMLFGFSTLG